LSPGSLEVRTRSAVVLVLVVAIAFAAVAASAILSGLPAAARLAANAVTCVLALLAGWRLARRSLPISLGLDGDTATLRVGAASCSFPAADAVAVELFVTATSLQIRVLSATGTLCRFEELLGCTREERDRLVGWIRERFAALPVSRVSRRLAPA
jgi:hypothetical protein